MSFSYTEHFKAASPLRGGFPGAAMGGGGFGTTDTAGGSGQVSTTLASCVILNLQTYGSIGQTSAALVTLISGGMIEINTAGACSGSWVAYGY